MRNLLLLLFAALVVAFIFGDDGEVSRPREYSSPRNRARSTYTGKSRSTSSPAGSLRWPISACGPACSQRKATGSTVDRAYRRSTWRSDGDACRTRLFCDSVSISQSGRWYSYRPRSDQFPIPVEEIVAQSANMHLIPSTTAVERTLKSARRGNIVDLTGYLVAVESRDGWKWRSSLSRTDSGGGSCELVWVRSAVVR